MGFLGEWSALRAFGWFTAALCAIGSGVSIGDPGGSPIATLVLAGLAAVALVVVRRTPGLVAGGALMLVACVMAADDLLSPGPYAWDDTVTGRGIPSAAAYLVWLSACLSALALVVAVVRRRWVRPGLVMGLVAAVLATGACFPAAIRVAGAAADSVNADVVVRTTAPDDRQYRADTTAPSVLRQNWEVVGGEEDDYSVVLEGVAVPGFDLAVVMDVGHRQDGADVIRVVDARTGAERWRYHLDSFQVHVSATHRRMLLTDGDAGMVLDLVTGNTVGVIPLPPHIGNTPWQMPGRLRLIDRTAVLLTYAEAGVRTGALLAVDVVAMTATHIAVTPGCEHSMAAGVAEPVTVIEEGRKCPRRAALRIGGDRMVGVADLGAPDWHVTTAHHIQGGFVVSSRGPGDDWKVELFRDGAFRSTLLGRGDWDLIGGGVAVLPGGSGAPERVLVTYAERPGHIFDARTGALLGSAPRGVEISMLEHAAVVGDRFVHTSLVDDQERGVLRVFDSRTFAETASVALPCRARQLSANGASVVVSCFGRHRMFGLGS